MSELEDVTQRLKILEEIDEYTNYLLNSVAISIDILKDELKTI